MVYPAYAGVILWKEEIMEALKSLSRIRGGDPEIANSSNADFKFIPHTRGWSYHPNNPLLLHTVYPAYAGVILI